MTYKTLFNINLLHAYFLDKGEKKYHAINVSDELSTEEKLESLLDYNMNYCLQIVPSDITREIIKNHRLMIRNHATGLRVLASTEKVNVEDINQNVVERYSPLVNLSEDLVCTFYIKMSDNYFENYSDIISRNEGRIYYLSNIPSSLTSSVTNIFDANGSVENLNDFLLTEVETRKLIYEIEKENQSVSSSPKFVSIAGIDEEDIVEMEDALADPQINLTEEQEEILGVLNNAVALLKNNKIIGIIQLKITGDGAVHFIEEENTENPSTGDFDLLKQCLPENEIDFQIYIENRKTKWRYHRKSTNQTYTTTNLYPLTKNGKIEIDNSVGGLTTAPAIFFPNPTAESITENQQEYFSELYI